MRNQDHTSQLAEVAKILANGMLRIAHESSRCQVAGINGFSRTSLDVGSETVLSVHGVNGSREPEKEQP